jgi:hypothetical protein
MRPEIVDMDEDIELESRVGRDILGDAGHGVVFAGLPEADRQRLSEGIFVAEILRRVRPGQDKIMLIHQGRTRVPGDEGEGEHLQEGGIDQGEILAEEAVFRPDGPLALDESSLAQDVGNGLHELRPHGRGNELLKARFLAGLFVELDLDKAEKRVLVLMETVNRQLVHDEQINEETGGDPERQAEDLDEGMPLVSQHVPECGFQIVPEHRLSSATWPTTGIPQVHF